MKKYKLIKEYPASPKLNSYAVINDADRIYCTIYDNNDKIWSNAFGRMFVENYPDFWELIEKSTYYWVNTRKLLDGDINLRDPFSLHCTNKVTNPNIEVFHSNYGVKMFSTEEKAKRYIVENKPCVSANEIINLVAEIYGVTHRNDYLISKVTNYVKDKLNIKY